MPEVKKGSLNIWKGYEETQQEEMKSRNLLSTKRLFVLQVVTKYFEIFL